MSRVRKPWRYWAITFANRQDEVMPWTIRMTRKQAMQAACYGIRNPDEEEWRSEWKEWRARGCRPVRIIIQLDYK